jgi:hypothetical protein
MHQKKERNRQKRESCRRANQNKGEKKENENKCAATCV